MPKQGASYGHTKIAGKQVLRKGLSPLATTISTPGAAPVITGMRLRAGKTGSGKGAGRMVTQAIATARAAGVAGQILVRGDSAYGTRAVVGACRSHGAQFSVVMTRNPAIDRAITAIGESAWTPVKYPGAVRDPDTGDWISDAEVAEISYTAFAATPDRFTARLVVRRVKDARFRDALFPVWRYHPFFTLEAMSLGGSLPTNVVWLTNASTTAWSAVAEIDAATGTVADTEMFFSFAPGITTSLISFVYSSRMVSVRRPRAALRVCSAVSALYDSITIAVSVAAGTDSAAAACAES